MPPLESLHALLTRLADTQLCRSLSTFHVALPPKMNLISGELAAWACMGAWETTQALRPLLLFLLPQLIGTQPFCRIIGR